MLFVECTFSDVNSRRESPDAVRRLKRGVRGAAKKDSPIKENDLEDHQLPELLLGAKAP